MDPVTIIFISIGFVLVGIESYRRGQASAWAEMGKIEKGAEKRTKTWKRIGAIEKIPIAPKERPGSQGDLKKDPCQYCDDQLIVKTTMGFIPCEACRKSKNPGCCEKCHRDFKECVCIPPSILRERKADILKDCEACYGHGSLPVDDDRIGCWLCEGTGKDKR